MDIKEKISIGMQTFFWMANKKFILGALCKDNKNIDKSYYIQYSPPEYDAKHPIESYQSGRVTLDTYINNHLDKTDPSFKFLFKE